MLWNDFHATKAFDTTNQLEKIFEASSPPVIDQWTALNSENSTDITAHSLNFCPEYTNSAVNPPATSRLLENYFASSSTKNSLFKDSSSINALTELPGIESNTDFNVIPDYLRQDYETGETLRDGDFVPCRSVTAYPPGSNAFTSIFSNNDLEDFSTDLQIHSLAKNFPFDSSVIEATGSSGSLPFILPTDVNSDNSNSADTIKKPLVININQPLYKVDNQIFQSVSDSLRDFEPKVREALLRILESANDSM